MSTQARNRLVAVSNRLPVILKSDADGWTASPGAGGLVTALAPILQARGGVWVGWPGVPQADGIEQEMLKVSSRLGYDLRPVQLEEKEVQGYYFGFSNEILWPLFHGFETRCKFDPSYWQDYVQVNRKFAEALAAYLEPNDFIWIHDYQLMLVASELRRLGVTQRIGFFLHVPFPAPDVFFKLPWRAQILNGLLDFDLVGFHTVRYRRNFTHCLQQLRLPGLRITGRGDTVLVELGGRQVRAGAFPISIDYNAVSLGASSDKVRQAADEIRQRFSGQKIMVGIDRLDYTKGIPERLEAFNLALSRYPGMKGAVSLVQVAVPSRGEVREYDRLRARIERLVGEINGAHTELAHRVPVHYLNRSLGRDEVYALLRAADVALITPLRDGMNLVAKEYCAAQVDLGGVLVLSEFAGAAAELHHGALLANPYDVEGLAEAMYQALTMPQKECSERMGKLRQQIARHDIFRWVDSFLDAAFTKHLSDFPYLQDQAPVIDVSDWGMAGLALPAELGLSVASTPGAHPWEG